MPHEERKGRQALGLAAIAALLLMAPLALNLWRGGAEGVGHDPRTQGSDLRFAVTHALGAADAPLRGRLVLVLSRRADPEPRFQEGAGPGGPYLFDRWVGAWAAGRPVEVTDSDPGVPLPSLGHIPPGHYWVQAVLDLADGGGGGALPEEAAPLSLEPLEPAGAWSRRAGNPVSRPVEAYVDPRSDDVIRVHLARTIPGTEPGPEPPP